MDAARQPCGPALTQGGGPRYARLRSPPRRGLEPRLLHTNSGVCSVSELDWLEREERYKTRISRTLVLTSIAAVLFFGSGFYILHRQRQAREVARQEASMAAALAERQRQLDEIAADSTAAAQRLIDFNEQYKAEVLEGAQVVLVPVPSGANLTRFLQNAWLDYARIVEPEITEDDAREWYHSHYVDVMNMAWYNSAGHLAWEGDLRPKSVLFPELRQRSTEMDFLKPSFTQVVRGQHEAGLRVEEAPEEGVMAMDEMNRATPEGGNTPSEGETPAPEQPPAEPPTPPNP